MKKEYPEARINKHHYSLRFSITLAIIILGILWIIMSVGSSWFSWKAVFLDNNQVYFGKMISIPFTSKITLRQVHFIRPDAPDTASSTASDIIIAPLSDMVHGPKNTMVISKNHILYYETLQSGTTLVKGLNKDLPK